MERLLTGVLPLVFAEFPQVAPAEDGLALRLGFGQYVDPDRNLARLTGRQHFLDAVVAVEPRVLDGLREEPFAAVSRLLAGLMDMLRPRLADVAARDDAIDELLADWGGVGEETLRQLEGPIRDWTARWQLGTPDRPWAAPAFVWTLMRWALQALAGEELDARLWDLPLGLPDGAESCPNCAVELPSMLTDEVTLDFPALSWNRRMETRAAAEARLVGVLKEQVREQLDRAEEAARARGDAPTPTKLSGLAHFEWLARYQVRGESFNDIARDSGVRRQSVAEAIKETAAMIDLPLREPDRPGRRPKRPGPPRIVRVERRAA